MKLLLITILNLMFLSYAVAQVFEDKYGIGIVSAKGIPDYIVNKYSTNYQINLYDDTTTLNLNPTKTYKINSREDKYWEVNKELNPLDLYHFSGMVMVCVEKRGEWFKVRIKNNLEYWVKNIKLTYTNSYGKVKTINSFNFYNWEQYISGTIWVSRLEKEKNLIRKKPKENSETINFDAPECLKAIKTKGFWLKITPENGEGCFDDNEDIFAIDYQKKYFKYGWIKWRNDKDFLINLK